MILFCFRHVHDLHADLLHRCCAQVTQIVEMPQNDHLTLLEASRWASSTW
jgi:hypothetical protein